jgi:hypothetical protein
MQSNRLYNTQKAPPIQDLIWANIKDLPKESIQEVLAFIVFVRTKNLRPELLTSPEYDLLNYELTVLDAQEAAHLELEFADYQSLYPHE